MITFIPCDNQNDIKEYFPKVEINSLMYLIKAVENDDNKGACLFSLNTENSSVVLEKIYIKDSDITTEEGLIRSVLNFAANRGIYMAYVSYNNGFNKALFKRMHFEESNNKLSCDIPTALTGSCCG